MRRARVGTGLDMRPRIAIAAQIRRWGLPGACPIGARRSFATLLHQPDFSEPTSLRSRLPQRWEMPVLGPDAATWTVLGKEEEGGAPCGREALQVVYEVRTCSVGAKKLDGIGDGPLPLRVLRIAS